MGAKESFTGVLNALVPPTAVATAAATPPPPTPPEARRHRAGARFESKVSDMDMDVMMRVEGYEHKGWLAGCRKQCDGESSHYCYSENNNVHSLSLLMSYLYLTYLYLLPSNARSPAKAKKGLL